MVLTSEIVRDYIVSLYGNIEICDIIHGDDQEPNRDFWQVFCNINNTGTRLVVWVETSEDGEKYIEVA